MNERETISAVSELTDRINIAQEELYKLKSERFELLIQLRNNAIPYIVLGSLMNVSRQRAKQLIDAYELEKLQRLERDRLYEKAGITVKRRLS